MKKPGHFASENKLVEDIRDETGTGKARNPITYLVEAADDIVYSVADMEDAVKKGVLPWKDMKDIILRSGGDVAQRAGDGMTRILDNGGNGDPSGLPDDVYASAFRTAAISVLVPSVAECFNQQYEAIMRGEFIGDLASSCDAADFIGALKRIGREHIYCTPATLKLEIMGRRVIADLMTIFWEGADKLKIDDLPSTNDFPGKIAALLSENYRRVFSHSVKENGSFPEKYHRYQLVTDYVCGMTDSFAMRLHRELTNG